MSEALSTLAEPELKALLARVQTLLTAGDLHLIYLNRHQGTTASAAYLREVAEVKRLLECWSADAAFRERIAVEPEAAVASLGLALDPAPLKYLWDVQTALATAADDISLSALRYRAFILEKVTHRNQMRQNLPSMDRRFATWRERQMRRAEHQLSSLASGSIVHAPFCIELCHGCSVGCWFCGIAAPRLEDIFRHTPENAALFSGVIEALQEIFGDATGRGFLYWATDPMDNPDYEQFMVDFHSFTGVFPQTTTALALKDIDRTRALLELSRQKCGMLDRFSLLSLKQLERVHKEFTAEELLYVELVTQNREGHQHKARSGRAMVERASRNGASFPGEQAVAGTIACVSGFLISMVERSVKLISPCQADERWPLGYIVFGEGRFKDAASFRVLVNRLADEHMDMNLRGDEPLAFQSFLKCEEISDGLRLVGPHTRIEFTDNPVFSEIGRTIRQAGRTADEVVEAVERETGAQAAEVSYALNLLLKHGLLDTLGSGIAPSIGKEVVAG
jgi:radical SAM family RiPP maturation amino acid epimerase